MNKFLVRAALAVTVASLLTACGAGAGGIAAALGGPDNGIGGTGVTSSGTIDGFGSIFVNGIKFNTDNAQIIIDGQEASEDDLALGMVVIVTGTINADGRTGVATRVVFDDEVEGPITSVTAGADGDTLLLDVVGQEVIVERTGTVIDDVTFETFGVGDVVSVSGFANEDSQLRATRVEKKPDLFVGNNDIEVNGVVNNLSGMQFTLGNSLVRFDQADLTGVTDGSLAEGMQVEVMGVFVGSYIEASRIEEEGGLSEVLNDDSDVELQGAVTDFVSISEFQVNSVRVDASNAALYPAGLTLGGGMEVQVDGVWDGQTLTATEIRTRRGRIEIEAAVVAVDTTAASVTLGLFGGEVTVQLEADTRLNDDTDMVDKFTIEDITAGDFLGVEAVLAEENLIATRIDRIEASDDVFQAPVEGYFPGISVTMLGISYSTVGAIFENGRDAAITVEDFYVRVEVGDLVKIRDKQTPDGWADVIEFERANELDGDREFDEDCQSGGSSGDDSDGICGSGAKQSNDINSSAGLNTLNNSE